MIRHIATILWPVAVLWAIMAALFFVTSATWPEQASGYAFTLVNAGAFFLLLAFVIATRMHGWDWLTASLISLLVATGTFFLYRASLRLGIVWVTEHHEAFRMAVTVTLNLALAWAYVMLRLTPDPEIEQQRRRAVQRKEDRAEGRAEGRITGHAEGMAQEHADQLEREDAA